MQLTQECLDRDYRGAGKAWAAVQNGQVVALRYMDHRPEWPDKPAWVAAIQEHATGLDERCLPVCRGNQALAKMAAAAQACADCPRPKDGERYRPTELLTMARAALAAAQEVSFTVHRKRCREELARHGEVVSGMCSCTEFIPQ